MPSPRSELDHALANAAQAYGLSRAQLDAAKQHALYGEMLADFEAHPGDRQALLLRCHMIFQACGHAPPEEPKPAAPALRQEAG